MGPLSNYYLLTLKRRNRRRIGITNLGLLSFALSITTSVPLSLFLVRKANFKTQECDHGSGKRAAPAEARSLTVIVARRRRSRLQTVKKRHHMRDCLSFARLLLWPLCEFLEGTITPPQFLPILPKSQFPDRLFLLLFSSSPKVRTNYPLNPAS